MSNKTRPVISDPNVAIPGTTMAERLQKYEEEKQEYSRIREEERINAPDLLDTFMEHAQKILNWFKYQNTK